MGMYDTWQYAKTFLSDLFWETWNLLMLSIVLTIVIFISEYGQVLVTFFERKNSIPSGLSEQLLSQTILPWLEYIDQIAYMDKISVALFWAIAALGLYMIYAFVGRLLEAAKDQLEVDKLSRAGLAKAVLVHFGEKIIAIIIFFAVIILCFAVLMQYWFQLINVYILSGLLVENVGVFIVGIIGLWITIYVLLVSGYVTWFYERKVLG